MSSDLQCIPHRLPLEFHGQQVGPHKALAVPNKYFAASAQHHNDCARLPSEKRHSKRSLLRRGENVQQKDAALTNACLLPETDLSKEEEVTFGFQTAG